MRENALMRALTFVNAQYHTRDRAAQRLSATLSRNWPEHHMQIIGVTLWRSTFELTLAVQVDPTDLASRPISRRDGLNPGQVGSLGELEGGIYSAQLLSIPGKFQQRGDD